MAHVIHFWHLPFSWFVLPFFSLVLGEDPIVGLEGSTRGPTQGIIISFLSEVVALFLFTEAPI